MNLTTQNLEARRRERFDASEGQEPWAMLAKEAGFDPYNTESSARDAFRFAAEKLTTRPAPDALVERIANSIAEHLAKKNLGGIRVLEIPAADILEPIKAALSRSETHPEITDEQWDAAKQSAPVPDGPLTPINTDTVQAAVDAERERCAELVRNWNGETKDGDTFLMAQAITDGGRDA